MKRLIGLLLVLTMLVGALSGCVFGDKDNASKDNDGSNTTPQLREVTTTHPIIRVTMELMTQQILNRQVYRR